MAPHKNKITKNNEIERGATVVISHHVRNGEQLNYENWLNEISPVCRSYPGLLDLQIIHPISGLTVMYTIIIRFDAHHYLQKWMESKNRQSFIEKVRPLLIKDDDYVIHSGLEEFWFNPKGVSAKSPKRWKQFLVTWSAIFILSPSTAFLFDVAMHQLGLSVNYLIKMLIVTAVVVLLMVYVVMPKYTRLVHRWLYE